jgi:pyruvate/2-oxoglutarate dehydrogenase complex dihydrolipoamide dehydrogenase (E3) component
MTRLDEVVHAHQDAAQLSLDMAHVERAQGKASFISPNEIAIKDVSGHTWAVTAQHVVIATGSRPIKCGH